MSQPKSRFALIDALRGIAALSVVVYHIYKQNLLRYARTPLIEPLHSLFVNGYLGVYIFFVLSGFVIAYSVRNARVTPGFIGRFALRRSLRLDPPYWVAIAAAVLLTAFANQQFEDRAKALPSLTDLVAHVFYAQQFFGIPHILGVFWTLCLEIQFYLAYVILVFITQRFARDRVWIVFGPFWVLSLVVGLGVLDWGHALFVWMWPFFFIGAVTAWHYEGKITTAMWCVVAAGTCSLLIERPEWMAVAAVTALLLFLAGRARRDGESQLQRVTLGRPIQFLGRISYSLYLTHLLFGSKLCRLGIRLLGNKELGTAKVVMLLVGCAAASVVVATIMYLVVERPAQALSQRINLAPKPAAPVGEL